MSATGMVGRTGLMASLSRGDAVTAGRIAAYCRILVVFSAIGLTGLAALGHGRLDALGRPLGADFGEVWAAGLSVLSGEPALPYDPAAHAAHQAALFGPDSGFFGWHYPPPFLLVAAALALLPYGAALAAYQASTLALAVLAVRRILPATSGVTLAALAFPVTFLNLGNGQNGFLTAGLMGLGLVRLTRDPVGAGLLLGLLCYKPQFGLVLPVALLAGRHFRAAVAAGATVLALAALTTAVLGTGVWAAFADSTAFFRAVILEQGATGWFKLQSAFAAMRAVGGGIPAAYAVQALVTAAVLAATGWRWRRRPGMAACAMVPAGALLTTPYCLDYDLTLLGLSIAFVVADRLRAGFAPFERVVLALCWWAPLLTRPVAQATLVPLGLIATGTVFWLAAATPARVTPPDGCRG